jgi:hypothetical protein
MTRILLIGIILENKIYKSLIFIFLFNLIQGEKECIKYALK